MTATTTRPLDHPPSTARKRRHGRWALAALGAAMTIGMLGIPGGEVHAQPSTSMKTLKVKSTSENRTVTRTDKKVMAERRGGKVLDRLVAGTGEQSPGRFSTVGVTWAKTSNGTTPDIQIRTKSVGGGWSEWETISDVEPIETDNGKLATDPIYVGDSDGLQVRALGDRTTTLSDVEVALVESPAVTSDSNPTTLAATAASDLAPRPSIVTRSGWGADERLRCDEQKMGNTIKGAVVHHTAGSNSYSSSQSASIIRSIYAYHTKTLGWCDIGYNFLVDKYGKIFEGRWGGIDYPIHGAHAADWNTNTVGVSFMGNYDTARPPAVMLESGAKILAWKLDSFQRNALGKVTLAGKSVNIIFRHGDVMATACPGRYVTSQMDALRNNVNAKMAGHSKVYEAWQQRGGESGMLGSPHQSERAIGQGRFAGFANPSTGLSTDMYWHPYHGDHIVYGTIRRQYVAMGGSNSPLHWPISDEKAGPLPGSRMNEFTDGRMIYTKATGAHPLHGAFDTLYSNLGSYLDDLGAPTGGEYKSTAIAGMVKQNFTHGRMYYLPNKGAFAVYGSISTKYRALGEEGSRLGRPISSEIDASVGRAVNFEHGRITWNRTTKVLTVTYS